jgi:hypothetical protein
MQTSTLATDRLIAERRFYSGMAIAFLITVVVGFARSFFLKPFFPDHPAPAETIFYVHGAAFSLWILLFVAQVLLISQQKADVHRKVGLFGAGLVVVMVLLGVFGSLTAAARSTGFIGLPIPPLQFLAIPIFDMIIFPAFVVAAFVQRHNSQSHKRWMLLATFNILTAAIARWPIVSDLGPLAYFGVTDLFIVALAVWDLRSNGRIHNVTLWGGLLTIISQPVRLMISGTDAWVSFADWAVSFVR